MSILDVVVDIRSGSPTVGKRESHELDDETMGQLYLPIGFADRFCVTREVAAFDVRTRLERRAARRAAGQLLG